MQNITSTAQKVTSICYTEKTRNLNYRIECDSLDDFKGCLAIIDQYNEFNALTIIDALKVLEKYNLKYTIGREGSPVIYISASSISNDLKYFHEDMQHFNVLALADEFDKENDSPWSNSYRLWFD